MKSWSPKGKTFFEPRAPRARHPPESAPEHWTSLAFFFWGGLGPANALWAFIRPRKTHLNDGASAALSGLLSKTLGIVDGNDPEGSKYFPRHNSPFSVLFRPLPHTNWIGTGGAFSNQPVLTPSSVLALIVLGIGQDSAPDANCHWNSQGFSARPQLFQESLWIQRLTQNFLGIVEDGNCPKNRQGFSVWR